MSSGSTSRPLEEYGLIGDTETLAIVHDSGSIDWLCWPRFDSHPSSGRSSTPTAATGDLTGGRR